MDGEFAISPISRLFSLRSASLSLSFFLTCDRLGGNNPFSDSDAFSPHFRYPYPLFEKLNTPQRIVLFGIAALCMTASTTLLQWLYGTLNGWHHELETMEARNYKKE